MKAGRQPSFIRRSIDRPGACQALLGRFGPNLPLLLLIGLPLIACRKIIFLTLLNRPGSCGDFNRLILESTNAAYNLGVLAPSYLEHGFIRRGLGGTILSLLGASPVSSCLHPLIIFHILSAVWLAIPLVLLVRRLMKTGEQRWIWLAIVLLGSPQLFWAWGGDLGRTDMLMSGFIAWSVLFATRLRYDLAVGCVLAGSLVHEMAAFYGPPLILMLWTVEYRAGAATLRQGLSALMAFLLGLGAIILGQLLFVTAGPVEIARSVFRSGEETFLRDVAAYMTVHGARGIATSMCQSFGRAATPLYLVTCYLVLALYFKILLLRSRHAAIGLVIVAALPMAAISLVAVDYGRWLMMAVLNGWLFATALHMRGEPPVVLRRDYIVAALILVALFAMKPTTVYSPNQAAEGLATRLWGPTSINLKRIEKCDPAWRSSLGLPAEPNYRQQTPWRKGIF